MSVFKCVSAVASLLWIMVMLLPVTAGEHAQAPAEANGNSAVSVPGGFPGWMRLVIVERSLERVARRSGSGESEEPGAVDSPEVGLVESALERAGLGPTVSRASATVSLSTIDRVELVGLEAARERLLPLDPRRDAYIETAVAIFDAWSGELDPARDAPDAEVVFLPDAAANEVEAVMTDKGFAQDEWVLLDASYGNRDESSRYGASDGSVPSTSRSVAVILPAAMAVFAAGVVLFRLRGSGMRLFALLVLVGAGLLAWRLGQSDDRSGASMPVDRQWTVVSVTGDAEDADRADNLFEAGQADFETARIPEIPHFGILVSHLAYQDAFAWGREFVPPQRGEAVDTPGLAVDGAHEEDSRIVFDDHWLKQRTSEERYPLAALLRSTAGMAPLEYRSIEVPGRP